MKFEANPARPSDKKRHKIPPRERPATTERDRTPRPAGATLARGRGAKGKGVRASGILVHCAFHEMRPAGELVPHPKNANTHPAKQLDRYEAVVVGNGWRRAVVVSRRSGVIIKGHGAVAMAARRGWEVPVEYQEYSSEKEELRDLVADNKLAELAETDDEKLRALLTAVDAEELALTGFDAGELERLLREAEEPEGDFPITARLNEQYDYVLVFCTNASDFVFLQTLAGVRTEKSYKKTGVGIGRAIPFERFLKALRENRHSLDVQGAHDDHAPAAAGRDRVRAEKPTPRVPGRVR